ncbi:hypothetical protein GHT06_007656 [Daphnia sinensis]|uniref:CCHC-type domain-containing protein n=1 Tax=Daphnia sinensis TaxID=1820382 RepID=A0AAD5KFM8_9CRUS|nr:hypothetical protein GHT06_007656 [Daphnia sinensis]
MANTTAKDTSHIAKFNGDNWRSYSFGIQMLFDKNRLSSVVDGTNVLPTQKVNDDGVVTNLEEIEIWKQKDVDAKTIIYATVLEKQQVSLQGSRTAKEMWDKLKTEYAELAEENLHFVMSKFFTMKYEEGQSVMAFINEVEQVGRHLDDLNHPLSEIQLINKIIMSLPPSYQAFQTVWDSVPAGSRTMNLLSQRLQKEEKVAKMYNNGTTDSRNTAFFASRNQSFQQSSSSRDLNTQSSQHSNLSRGSGNRGGRGRGRGGFNGKRQKTTPYSVTCYECQKPGHLAKNCWFKKENKQANKQDFGYQSSICFTARRRIHHKTRNNRNSWSKSWRVTLPP